MVRRGAVVALSLALCASVAIAQGEWVTIRPAGMGFTAAFPETPTEQRTPHRDAHGEWIGTSWRALNRRTGETFQVSVKDYTRYDTSGVPISQVLEATCTAIDRHANVAPLQASVPARRCSLTDTGGTEMHVYWSAPRLYVVAHGCGTPPCDRAATARFFRAFSLR